jgi:hypothetical protein
MSSKNSLEFNQKDSNNELSFFNGLKSDNFKNQKLAFFNGKKIRKTWFEKEWWFSVVDIAEALTNSTDPNDYWYRLKKEKWKKARLSYRHFVDN